ncbi:uncharacterized protein LOC109830224 isoform X2 [Asparagus officinalis]|uniref:uncharacterized protein LOC109830224 isoform X2 n=1 Tax=Asparagus officinalis TaxID=4686 RepID=UPI00098E152A|nr:uncharacterized protein LOC109830224 isoform X2 [Asparagus officinalis]
MAEQPATFAPPSPGISPVNLSDCIEDLLHFTLSTYLQVPPLLDLGFSKDYCSRLLQLDEADPISSANRDCGGVPAYPLYKPLARAVERSIKSGSLGRERRSIDLIPVDESVKAREKEWNELIADKGSEILNMLEGVDFELHVQEPYFSQLRDGRKTVEGRCGGNYSRITPGAVLLFNKCLLFQVQHVNRYSSFYEMLKVEGLSDILPGVETVEEGVQIYRKFYTEEKETASGVFAIYVSRLASQPYISLGNLLSGLGYDGVGGLLGMMHTAGTDSNALPPPRSAIIASSKKPHHPNVKGCILTNGARALAKHVNKSSEGWWGYFSGSDSNKNRIASEVINHLVDDCCWMNIHFIKPHECVFEVRVHEGYGARWSADGTEKNTVDSSRVSVHRIFRAIHGGRIF